MSRLPTLSDGEVVCPRKSNPFPGVISVGRCLELFENTPNKCEEHRCKKYMYSFATVQEMNKPSPSPGNEVSDGKSSKKGGESDGSSPNILDSDDDSADEDTH